MIKLGASSASGGADSRNGAYQSEIRLLYRPQSNIKMEFTIEPKKVALTFFWCVAFLTVVNSIVLFFYFRFDDPKVFGLVRWFDFDTERNIPTLYSSFLILFCALLFSTVAVSKQRNNSGGFLYWIGLSIVFLFLSVDEMLKIHENIGDLVEKYVTATDYIYFPWVIPYGIAVGIFVLAYMKFLTRLPKETMILFLASGVIYLAGAAGLDMLGGREAYLHGMNTITYCILYTCEEFCEMIGVIILIYALLSYMVREIGFLTLTFETKPRT